MPLPDGRDASSAWPPPAMQAILDSLSVWDAWYTGDVQGLETVYAQTSTAFQGGLWGGIRRFFWGSPNPAQASQAPVKVHEPVAASVCRMSTSLLFGELFTPVFRNDHDADDVTGDTRPGAVDGQAKADATYTKATARVQELLDDEAHAALLHAGELAAAHGGVFLVGAIHKATHPHGPFVQVRAVDTAVPEFSFGKLTAVTFWTRLAPRAGQQYLLLERHEVGRITWGLYESNSDRMLGTPVDLRAHPDAAAVIPMLDEHGDGMATELDSLDVVYLPNVTPNRRWRKHPVGQYLGRSDLDGAEDLMDSLDEVVTSYLRDFRLGKTRIMVPKGFLQAGKPGEGATFDTNQEVFTELGQESIGSFNPNASGNALGQQITTFQPGIRHLEHEAGRQVLKEAVYEACGYSAQTFGAEGDMAVTATEVTAREKQTILTRSHKVLVATPAVVDLLCILMDLDAAHFDGPGRNDIVPLVEWPDAASDSPKVLAETLQALNMAEATSIRTRVETLHPDWSKEQVAEEVQQIRDDVAVLPIPTEKTLWSAQGGPEGDPAAPPSDLKASSATPPRPETGDHAPAAPSGGGPNARTPAPKK
jgi:hypothetical protein